MKSGMVEYSSHDSPSMPDVKSMEWKKSIEQKGEEYSHDLADTLRSLREDIRS